jgi:hypothetical protein|tara:strand:+ start:648 stop:938 length:291 start_codon:yes stop_codon:yes gene_type:complete
MNLPNDFPHQPPENYSYEVTQHKRNVVAIWLRDYRKYVYTSDDVRTIWGFYDTKRGEYFAPINHKKQGQSVDITDTRSYTAMQLNLNPLMSAFNYD